MFRRRPRADRSASDASPTDPARGGASTDAVPAWRVAVERSLAMLGEGDAWARERVGEVIAAIETAADDRARVTAALEQLDMDHTTQQLKVALREAAARPSELADEEVTRWRERYATVHRLADRLEELDLRIAKAVRDVDAFAVRTVELTVGSELRPADIRPLADDLAALEAAHDEIRRLGVP